MVLKQSAISYGLTPQQQRALSFIRGHIAEHGFSPSYREIMIGLGLASKCGVHRLIHALVERKKIAMLPDTPRSIALLPASRRRAA